MNTDRKFYITRYGEGKLTTLWSNVLKKWAIDPRMTIITHANDEAMQSPLGKELFEQRVHTEDNGIYTSFDFNLLFSESMNCSLANVETKRDLYRTTFTIDAWNQQYMQGFLITEHNPSHRRIRHSSSIASEQLSQASEGDYIDITHRHWFLPYSQAQHFQYSLRRRIVRELNQFLVTSELREQVEINMNHFDELSKQFDIALQQSILPIPRLKDEENKEITNDYGVTIHCSQSFIVDENLFYYAPKLLAVLRQDLFFERIFIAYLLKNLSSLAKNERNRIGLLLDIQLYVDLPVIDEMLAGKKEFDSTIIENILKGISEALKEPYRELAVFRAHLTERRPFVLFTHFKRALANEHMAWLNAFDQYIPHSIFSSEYRRIMCDENSTIQDLQALLDHIQAEEKIPGLTDIFQPLHDLTRIISKPITFEIQHADDEQAISLDQHEKLCSILDAFNAMPSLIKKWIRLAYLYHYISRGPNVVEVIYHLTEHPSITATWSNYYLATLAYDKAKALLDLYTTYHAIPYAPGTRLVSWLFTEMTAIALNAEIAIFLKQLLFSSTHHHHLRKSVEYLLDKKENEGIEILYNTHHTCMVYVEDRKLLPKHSSSKKLKIFSLLLTSSEEKSLTIAFKNENVIERLHILRSYQGKITDSTLIKTDAEKYVDVLRLPMATFRLEDSPVKASPKKERANSYTGTPSPRR